MKAYVPLPQPAGDHQRICDNGMWYLHWQGGFDDILKRGYPRPKYKTTILCELHSPHVADFLHGGGTEVPFLVTHETKLSIRRCGLTGIRFASVEVVKIATRGKRKRQPSSGEPEDPFLKAKNQIDFVTPPKLHAAYVTGRMPVVPIHPTGRSPEGYISPFLVPNGDEMPDLWEPWYRNRKLGAWTFCSERFKQTAERHQWSNISFEPAQNWITRMVGPAE